MDVHAIIVAAGSSSRSGVQNKSLCLLAGKPVIAYTLETFDNHNLIQDITLVVRKEDESEFRKIIDSYKFGKITSIVYGGTTRQDSVYNGIKSLKAHTKDIVVIHNGCNIFVNNEEIIEAIKAAQEHGASVVGFPAKDTLKQHCGGFIECTIPRENIWQVQTPQVIRYDIAIEAFDKACKDGVCATDDVNLVERIGKKVKLVPCSSRNFKITTKEDLALAEAILKQNARL
jgi:2-C-methyl-D-erythritol 4-phosphate cytidylyltransferase